MKKSFLIIGGLLILSLIGLSLYIFIFRGDPIEAPGVEESFTPPEEIVAETVGIDPATDSIQLSSRATITIDTMTDGSLVAVFGDGFIGIFDKTGTLSQGFDIGFTPIISARIAQDGDRVAFKVLNLDSLTGRWYVWDKTELSSELLGTNVRDVQFAPDGTLTRVEQGDDRITTNVVEEERERTILSSQIPDLEVRWVDNIRLLLTTTPSGEAPGIAYLFNTQTRTTERLLGSRNGLVSLIDKGGNILFSSAENKGTLQSYTLSGGEERSLPVVTLPERCTLIDTGLSLCSTLESQRGGVLMPDDYYKGLIINTVSRIVRIDMRSGTAIIVREVPFDASLIEISDDGQYLFAINKNNGTLWRLRLDPPVSSF